MLLLVLAFVLPIDSFADPRFERAETSALADGEVLWPSQPIDCPADFLPLPHHPRRLARLLWLRLNMGTTTVPVPFEKLEKYASERQAAVDAFQVQRQPYWERFLYEAPADFLLGNEASAKWLTDEMMGAEEKPTISREALLQANREFLNAESHKILMHLYLKAYAPASTGTPIKLNEKVVGIALKAPDRNEAYQTMRAWMLLAYPSSIDLSQDRGDTMTLMKTVSLDMKFDYATAVGEHLLERRTDDSDVRIRTRLQKSARFSLERELERVAIQRAVRIEDYFTYPLDLNGPPNAARWKVLKEQVAATQKSLSPPPGLRLTDENLLLAFEAELLAFRRWAGDVGIKWETAHLGVLSAKSGFLEAIRKGDRDTARRIATETSVGETPDPNTSQICSDKGLRFREAYLAMLMTHLPDAETARTLSTEFERVAERVPYTGDAGDYGNRLSRALSAQGKKASPETIRLVLHTQTETLAKSRSENTLAWQTPFDQAGVPLNNCMLAAYQIIWAARRAGLGMYSESVNQVIAATCPAHILQSEARLNALLVEQAKRAHEHAQEGALVNQVLDRISKNQEVFAEVKKLESAIREAEDSNLKVLLPQFRSLAEALTEAHRTTREFYLAVGHHRSSEIETLRLRLLGILGDHLEALHPLKTGFDKSKLPAAEKAAAMVPTDALFASLVFLQYRGSSDGKLYYSPKPAPSVAVGSNFNGVVRGYQEVGRAASDTGQVIARQFAAQDVALSQNAAALSANIREAVRVVEALPLLAPGATPSPLPPTSTGSLEAFLDVVGLNLSLPKAPEFVNEALAKLYRQIASEEAWNTPMARAQITALCSIIEANMAVAAKLDDVGKFIVEYPHRAAYEGLGFIPGPGAAKGFLEATTGYNIFGDQLSPAERGMAIFSVVPFQVFKPVGKALSNVAQRISGARNAEKFAEAAKFAQGIERGATKAKLTTAEQYDGLVQFFDKAGKGKKATSTVEGVEAMVAQHGTHLRDWRRHYRLKEVHSADELNTIERARGFQPPYQAGTLVFEAELRAADTGFARLHLAGNRDRAWIVRETDIRGLSPQQMKDRLNLPYVPTHISDVHVAKGTRIRMSEVGPNDFGSGTGGVTQYELLTREPGRYMKNTREIKP